MPRLSGRLVRRHPGGNVDAYRKHQVRLDLRGPGPWSPSSRQNAEPGVTFKHPQPFQGDPPITDELVREHNLSQEEYRRIRSMLGRTPTFVELGIFSALWSEHCSYKHSRPVLRLFPTEGPQVLQGPGENAGVIRVGDGWAVA